jgi:hypothetical protein
LKDFPAACELEGLLIQYSYMSAIFWLNAMSHMMWTTFRKFRPVQIRKTGLRHPKYKWYALYSWGCPLLVSIVTLVMQHLPSNVTKDVTTPRIGQVNCFLAPDNAILYYFHVINAPVLVIAYYLHYIRLFVFTRPGGTHDRCFQPVTRFLPSLGQNPPRGPIKPRVTQMVHPFVSGHPSKY